MKMGFFRFIVPVGTSLQRKKSKRCFSAPRRRQRCPRVQEELEGGDRIAHQCEAEGHVCHVPLLRHALAGLFTVVVVAVVWNPLLPAAAVGEASGGR